MLITPSGISITRTIRATSDIQSGAAIAVFTVGTGMIYLFGFVGQVTSAIGTGVTPDLKFQSNPTTGTTTDLCAALNIADDAAGTLYTMTGIITDALLRSEHGGIRDGLWGNPFVIGIGDIEAICDENVAGSIQLTAWWAPITDGATLIAV
jgi:hypothetical protein